MSNRLFQGVVHQMREAIDRTIGVIDETMSVIACSDLGRIGEVSDAVNAESFSAQEAFMRDGYTYKPFGSRPRSEYILVRRGNGRSGGQVRLSARRVPVQHQAVLRRKVRPGQFC